MEYNRKTLGDVKPMRKQARIAQYNASGNIEGYSLTPTKKVEYEFSQPESMIGKIIAFFFFALMCGGGLILSQLF